MMGCYVIRHKCDGLAGAMLLHSTPISKTLVFDYPSTLGNPSLNELLRFASLPDAQSWLDANQSALAWGGLVADGFPVWFDGAVKD